MAGYIGANTSSVTNNQNAAERRKKFTFTANTTVLSGLNFAPQKIHIFHNGIRLVRTTDYTEAADGKSVTLVNAAQAGDEVVAVTFAQDPASNPSYTDADVDAHLLTAGVTLDATNDRLGVGQSSPQQLIDASAASADTRIRVHSNTNSTPSAGIELMRGTNTTFGADAYTDFRIENINGGHLTVSTGESGTTTEQFRVNSDGHVTKPNQPSCLVRAGNANHGIGNGINDAVGFNSANSATVLHNDGNHWSPSSYTFTAPVTGRYHFSLNLYTVTTGSGSYVGSALQFSNIGAVYCFAENGSDVNCTMSMVVKMAANDTVYPRTYGHSSYTQTYIGSHSYFSAHLLG